VVWCGFGDKVAMLNLGSGLSYGLNNRRSHWALLQKPRGVRDSGAAIQREPEIDQVRRETDLAASLSALAAVALVEVDHGSAD